MQRHNETIMNPTRIIARLTFLIVVSVFSVVCVGCSSSRQAARPVKLVITGPEGQRFTGSYTADGVTNVVSAVVPTTISLRTSEVTYNFQPADDRKEFRVALDVEDLVRTSFVSQEGKNIRGGWRSSATAESAW
jgi:hypothetical protein